VTRSSLPAVPTGLTGLLARFPPINRWAILTGPSGTEDEDLTRGPAIFVKRSSVKKSLS